MAADMACDIVANNVDDELEELEVTESDAALLRELLEELENENMMINKEENYEENCPMESPVDVSEVMNVEMFHEHVTADIQLNEYNSNIYDSSWIDLVEASHNDVAVSDWYGGDNAIEMIVEHCNNVGDYSYMYNEMTFTCLWEDES